MVHCGYQTPALQHNPATLEILRKDLGFFACFGFGLVLVFSVKHYGEG